MSLLWTGSPPPSAFIVSAMLLVSKAALFHDWAAASPGLSQPAAATSVSSVTPPPDFNTCLRVRFIPCP